MTSYKDYFFLLPPGEHIITSVKYCKLLVQSMINDYPGCQSKAHISIKQYPRQKPYMIDSVVDQMEAKLKTMPCITLKTDDFRFFEHPNNIITLYTAIKPTFKADNWLNELRANLNISAGQFVPHITVAKTIPVDNFYKVWPRFYNRKFQDEFLVDRLFILEKETLNAHAKWKVYREIRFNERHVIN